MMDNNNFSFKKRRKNLDNYKKNYLNNRNIDCQTTEPNSTTIQNIIQKQKRLYNDITTLSSNLNNNFDLNKNHNNNVNIKINNDYNKISSNTNSKENQFRNERDNKNISLNNLNLIKDQQSEKINELINKFNNLYSSENNNKDKQNYNINNDYNLKEEKEINFQDSYTLSNNYNDNNGNMNNENININNLSSDNIINNRHNTHIDLNKNNHNKSADNAINSINESYNTFNYEKRINNYNSKDKNLIQNTYFPNRNKFINRDNYHHNFIRPKQKSHSFNQISRTYKNSPSKNTVNKYYLKNKENNPELSTISIKANMVINDFKKTLIEAEKMENELNRSKLSIKTFAAPKNGNNIINTFSHLNLNQTNTDIITNNSYLNTNNNSKNNYKDININDLNFNEDEFIYEDEIDKLKLQNLILIKTNQDLKNQNKILTHEINSYKKSSIYKNPFTQYDKDLNIFIQDLKTGLENATQSNQEFENIINNTQKENKVLNEKNDELLANFELAKDECEKMAKENSELKVELENKIEEIKEKENNLNKLEKEINNLNNIINNNKNQINYLNSIQESSKLSQKDNEDLIVDLKNTIENLQKINLENNNEIIDLKKKVEEYKNSLNSKQNEITILKENINEKEIIIKNKDNQINEFNNIIKESKNNNSKTKDEIQNINIEKEKLKNEIKTIKMLLADRERTISAQKNSISFLTKTFNKNINMINDNINNAMMNEENQNTDLNKGLKLMVEKMQKEISELSKKSNKNEKEKIQLEKDLSEFNEQYEQIRYDYKLLLQKYKEQNNIIEVLKREFLSKNNDKELQHLTKINFDILGKLKKTENENILKTQQLEQLKKNYDLINNQFIEFTKNNYNSSSNNASKLNNNKNENIIMNSNNENNKSIEVDINNIPQIPFLKNENQSHRKLMNSQDLDELLLQYSNENNSEKINLGLDIINNNNDINNKEIEKNGKYCNDIYNNMNQKEKENKNKENLNTNIDDINNIFNKKKENFFNNNNVEVNNNIINYEANNNTTNILSNINLKTESIENSRNASEGKNDIDKIIRSYKDYNSNNLNIGENLINSNRSNNYNNNEIINLSEEIKEKLTECYNNSLSDLQNKNNYSTQMEMNKIELNNLDILSNNNKYISQSMQFHFKNDNNKLNLNNNENNINQKNYLKELEINDNLSDENININRNIDIKNILKDQNLVPYPNLYTLRGNKIISFNLFEKKFILINPKDNTNGFFSIYLSKNKSQPLTLNSPIGFLILLDDYIFHYNMINNTINILTKILSLHQDGGFIYINNEIYSLSGKDCLLCEKYSNNKKKNIKLPSVNFERINSGLCNINNEYLYIFFGNKCDNSIERLNLSINYETMKEYINNWEYIQINSVMDNGEKIGLERFTLFLDDYNNVIILGGNDSKGKSNQNIYGLNLINNEICSIGKIDTSALYIGQNIQLDDSIFAIYDTRYGLHFFNKELDYHEIYNFNI